MAKSIKMKANVPRSLSLWIEGEREKHLGLNEDQENTKEAAETNKKDEKSKAIYQRLNIDKMRQKSLDEPAHWKLFFQTL